jgi:hypothetical protein
MPVRIARIILGSRNPITISSACGFEGDGIVKGIESYHAPTAGRYVCRKFWTETAHAWATDRTVSSGEIETVPMPAEKMAAMITITRRKTMSAIRRPLPALYRECTVGATPGCAISGKKILF